MENLFEILFKKNTILLQKLWLTKFNRNVRCKMFKYKSKQVEIKT